MDIRETFNAETNKWIDIDASNGDDLSKLNLVYGIDEEIIGYSLDRNERAHVEYDEDTGVFFLIYHAPNLDETGDNYETFPFTFIVKDNYLITISSKHTKYITTMMEKYVHNHPEESLFHFLFKSLFLITAAFFPLVEKMDINRKHINDKLREKTTKENLLGLSDLETGIVYLVSASKQNTMLLEQIKAQAFYRKLTEFEKEQLDDALIEARQLLEMTQLSSQILQQLSGTYNNVLNNNLNDTMKILTVLSVLLTLPTIITGFFGMNMPLPLEHNRMGWIISIGISLVSWFLLSFVLRRRMR